ncbi:WD repeat-containing protein 34 [Terramyces sp. JEL0728]|nr:WD repeat-containing protein 34 [Terramyces sp. JEL0728]
MVEIKKFSDYNTKITEIKSSWKNEKQGSTGKATQTPVVKYENTESQSVEIRNQYIQTDKEPQVNVKYANPNHQTLTDFLQSVEPIISSLLLQNIKSTAFDKYFVDWEEQVDEIACLYTLFKEDNEGLCVADLAWNATGSTIAAAYGTCDHKSWCEHRGYVCAWNLSARDFNGSVPSFSVEVQCCVMCVGYHPTIPSLLAGGTFNGEIILWNVIDNQDPVVSSSQGLDISHQEPVNQLRWLQNEDSDHFRLVSVGSEGKVLFWEVSNNNLKPVLMSQIESKFIPRLVKSQTLLGMTRVGYSTDNPYELVIGTETGVVARCSVRKFDAVPSVTAISFSPYHHNLFLTSGIDGNIKLFHLLSSDPLFTWEPSTRPIISVQWSHARPSVFSCVAADSAVYIFDLLVSTTSPAYEYKSAKEEGAKATSFHINNKRKDLVAVGENSGGIKIWRMKSALVNQVQEDILYIQELGSVKSLFK